MIVSGWKRKVVNLETFVSPVILYTDRLYFSACQLEAIKLIVVNRGKNKKNTIAFGLHLPWPCQRFDLPVIAWWISQCKWEALWQKVRIHDNIFYNLNGKKKVLKMAHITRKVMWPKKIITTTYILSCWVHISHVSLHLSASPNQ